MSQFYNSPNSTSVNTNATPRNDECWVVLLDNLAVFISAASNLVKSLQQTIELSKSQAGEGFDEEFLCACSKLSENIAGLSMKDTGFLNQTKPETTTCLDKLTGSENQGEIKTNPLDSIETEDCKCEDLSDETRSSTKRKSKTPSKSRVNKKQTKELYSREKSEKLCKLRENLRVAQKNLLDIQEQVRQLERLYQDYDSFNTSQGQVNPAALYKEIMKPHTVPYVTTNNSKVSASQVSSKTSACPGPCADTTAYNDQGQCRKLQEKVSILSTVPLEQSYF